MLTCEQTALVEQTVLPGFRLFTFLFLAEGGETIK